jgi:farnesyl-diphosphate farnesyltransferase
MSSPEAGAATTADAGDDELQAFLQKTSRTFALTIPMLPATLRREIGVAYLLFRVIDTFEDATAWAPARRVEALEEFVTMLDEDGAAPRSARTVAAAWTREPPVAHQGYIELLGAAPRVIDWYHGLAPASRRELRRHVAQSARGMGRFVERTDARGVLRLQTIDDLHDYCFVVAGLVGQMLTELFVLGDPRVAVRADELRARAVRFGEALQLVNILKDAGQDQVEGRVYLPEAVPLAEVFMLARADLRAAAEYCEILRAAGADRGLVAFNAVNANLAIATLRLVRDRGPGAKLTRPQVIGIVAGVMHALDHGAPLFDSGDHRVDPASSRAPASGATDRS